MSEANGAARLGIWGAALSAFFSIGYIALQLLEWAGLLGSAGGPESESTPLGIALLLIPSLLLGPAFVVTMIALNAFAPPPRKAVAQCAVAFAICYATLTGLVYFVQLTFVAPEVAKGNAQDIALLLFIPYKSFLFAIDLWGYSLMSIATLFAAFALPDVPKARWAKAALLANGLLFPFLALQMFVPQFIWPASLWAVTFPASAVLLVEVFKRCGAEPAS